MIKIDKTKPEELDIDDKKKFGDIICVQYYENKFYILANRLNNELGQFMFYMDEVIDFDDPEISLVYH